MATLEELEDVLVQAGRAGDEEAVTRISDAMKAHPTFQRNAKEKLDSGRYKLADDGFTELSKDEQRANMSKLTARSLGLNDDEVDVTQGMGFKGRLSLSFQPTEQDKFQELEKRYGRENIQAIDIGGKTKLLYRDAQETNNQFRAVDEEGTSIADFFADTAGAAVPIAGAIGAAIATGGTSIPLTALAAAGGGFAASAGQDIAVRAASDEDIRLGEIGRRRGLEMAIGIPIDLVTGVGGRIIAKSVGKRTVEKAAGDLTKQVDDLLARRDPGANIQLTPAQATNVDASLAQSVRAGLDQGGLEDRALAAQRDQIGKVARILRGEDVIDEPIEDVMQSITERQFRLIDAYEKRVAIMDAKILEADALAKNQTKAQRESIRKRVLAEREAELKAMREQAEEGVQKLVKGRQRLESAMGGDIRSQQKAGYDKTEASNKALYERAYALTDTIQANTPVSTVKKILDRIDDNALMPDSPELNAVKLLRRRIAENPQDLSFRELDRFVRGVTDKINYKKKFGTTQTEFQLQQIGRRLDKLVDDAMGPPKTLGGRGAGEPARKAHRLARKNYKEKVLPFFDGDRKANLAMVAGGSDVAIGARGANVMNRTFATNESVKDALNSGVNRDTLREAYLERQVAAAGDGNIVLSPDIMAALYPRGGAKAITAKVKAINDAIRQSKNKASVTKAELDELMSDFTPGAASKVKRYIESKAASQAKAKEAAQNALVKISKGEMPVPDDIHHLVGAIAKMRPGQIAKLMERLPSDRARASLGRSAFDSLMEKAGKASAKAQRTGKATDSQALWEPDTMSRILNNSAERKQWEALIGKDVVADLDKLNNWLLSSSSITRDMAEGIGRFVTSTGASGTPNVLFVSPQLPRWIGRKILGIVHTSPLTRAMMMRKLKTAELDEQAVMNLFYVAMGTQRGMSAISDEMAKDPAFSAWVQESSKGDPGMSPEAP
jgi:hypothetical protein